MKKTLKKISRISVSLLIAAAMLFGGAPVVETQAAKAVCETYEGRNVEAQNYLRWASTIKSYLTALPDGRLMRVQYGLYIEGLLVEYYDREYNLLETKIVQEELPIFGGFYACGDYYYVVTGQTNTEESDTKEIYRITKYRQDWTKVDDAGLAGCNTTVPFDAGSCRMTDSGKYLLIRTSHEMYTSEDGKNHQANVTIQLDMETMEITDSYTGVMNTRLGYVSHSFNQFIRTEDNRIVAVDHGDANPRSIVLLQYQTDFSSGKFVPDYFNSPCRETNVLEFPGIAGENTTGASVGSFEISSSKYLVAGNSVVQDSDNLTRTTRNVFVAAVDKQTSQVTIKWLTSHQEGEGTTSTPHMVKVSDNKYIVLWSQDGKVYYTSVDENGTPENSVYSIEGNLSDCVPVVYQDQLVWYTWNENIMTFYDISLQDLSENHKTEIVNGHHYENLGVTDGVASLQCSVCGQEEQMKVATSMNIWWNDDGGSIYTSYLLTDRIAGDKLHFMVSLSPQGVNNELEVVSTNKDVASVVMEDRTRGVISVNDIGVATITFRPKYNPEYSVSYQLIVTGPLKINTFEMDKISSVSFGEPVHLQAKAVGGRGTIQYRFYEVVDGEEPHILRNYSEEEDYIWIPEKIGKRTLYVDVKDGMGTIVSSSISNFEVTKAEKAPNMPDENMNVSYSITKVGQISLPDGWTWLPEDADKALTVGETVSATAIYKDQENYKIFSVKINIVRSTCEHIESGLIVDESPTCIAVGRGHIECTVCGEILKSNIEIPVTDHHYGDWKYSDKTSHTGTCGTCGRTVQENHQWDGGVVTKKPTYTEEGVKTFTCTVCGYKKTEAVSKTELPKQPEQPHSQTPAVAVGQTVTQKGLKYKITNAEKKEVALENVSAGKQSVSVPATVTVNGVQCKVTSIAAKAFFKCKKLKKAVIGKNIQSIGSRAFYQCKKLKKITIKSKVLKKVGKQAVKGIHKKALIKVPKKMKKSYQKLFKKKSGFIRTMKLK